MYKSHIDTDLGTYGEDVDLLDEVRLVGNHELEKSNQGRPEVSPIVRYPHPATQMEEHYFYRTRVRSLVMLVSDSLTHSLTDCRLVNLIDVSLACEDGNSKLVVDVTVVDVDDEDCVGNSLLQIWKLRNGHNAELLFRP